MHIVNGPSEGADTFAPAQELTSHWGTESVRLVLSTDAFVQVNRTSADDLSNAAAAVLSASIRSLKAAEERGFAERAGGDARRL